MSGLIVVASVDVSIVFRQQIDVVKDETIVVVVELQRFNETNIHQGGAIELFRSVLWVRSL